MSTLVALILALSFGAMPARANTAAASKDPYQSIEIYRLKNKLSLVIAPSTKAETVDIRVEVNVGFRDEAAGKAGTAHLLEHYLFQGKELSPGYTYVDLIKEKGGSANATTDFRQTSFYATVEPQDTPWALDIFGKILLNKKFTQDEVEIAKKPVYLEIGRPHPFDYLLAKRMPLLAKMTQLPSFWESEFGFVHDYGNFVAGADKIDTDYLTAADLKDFYREYYRPENMTVFVAGKIDPEEVKAQLEALFGQTPYRSGPSFAEKKSAPKIRPYRYVSVTSDTPRIEIGAKVAGLSPKDEMISDVYLEFLAHRLMKDLRNTKGETYTVSAESSMRRRDGYISLEFDTSTENYRKNLAYVRDILHRETQTGEISEEQFKEAIKYYGKRFKLSDRDAYSMMNMANYLVDFRRDFPSEKKITPYVLYTNLNFEDYKDRLKFLFRPQMRMENLVEPPLFFRYDSFPLIFMGFCVWMYISKRIFARRFPHNHIRWIRNVRYFPAYVIRICALGLTAFLITVAGSALLRLWYATGLNQQQVLISEYLRMQISVGMAVVIAQFSLCLFIRKAMVAEGKLWLKSLGYCSLVYPLSELESVELIHPLRLLGSPRLMYRIGFRFFYYFDLHFWQPGLLIHLQRNRAIFIAITEPQAALEELRAHLPQPMGPAQQAILEKAA